METTLETEISNYASYTKGNFETEIRELQQARKEKEEHEEEKRSTEVALESLRREAAEIQKKIKIKEQALITLGSKQIKIDEAINKTHRTFKAFFGDKEEKVLLAANKKLESLEKFQDFISEKEDKLTCQTCAKQTSRINPFVLVEASNCLQCSECAGTETKVKSLDLTYTLLLEKEVIEEAMNTLKSRFLISYDRSKIQFEG